MTGKNSGIKIEKIIVKNLGPIQDFSEKFGLFNIIYSKNERGKTFLTEFIIRSLFKNIKRWKFREDGVGKVVLSGLGEKGNVEFFPGSSKKLEDYWEKDEKGMPLSMVNLLVSKGGEASIEDTEDGISKNLIREIFSGFSLLDKIDSDSNISKTVKAAELIDGRPNISKAGEGRIYRQLRDDINQIDQLFEEIESKYGGGIIESYRAEEKILEDRRDKLYRAKCHKAYIISEKIKVLNKKIPPEMEEKLNELSRDIGIYETKKNEYRSKADQLKEILQKCKDFEWLQKARQLYDKLISPSVRRPNISIIIVSAVLVVAAVLFSIFNITIGTIISVVISAALSVFYIMRLSGASKYTGMTGELDKIKKEFKNRTNKNLTDIAVLDAELEGQKIFHDRAGVLEEQLKEAGNEINSIGAAIQREIYNLTGEKLSESVWVKAVEEKKAEIRATREEIESLYNKKSELGVAEVDYSSEDPGIIFNSEEFKNIGEDLNDIQNKTVEKEKELESLKYSICVITGDDSSIEWGALMEKLRIIRKEKQDELEICEAEIIAGILVHREINLLRKEEDSKIQEGLRQDVVLEPLRTVTKSYGRLSLSGEELLISDDYRDFCLKDMSTGIKEQIMLALRIGFSSKILKNDKIFLILDDAFQHSDWKRREMLVKKLAEIAITGWQIIYLSMDDHIKDLFEREGSSFNKNDFRSITL